MIERVGESYATTLWCSVQIYRKSVILTQKIKKNMWTMFVNLRMKVIKTMY